MAAYPEMLRRDRLRRGFALLLLAAGFVACDREVGCDELSDAGEEGRPFEPVSTDYPIVAAAGDIASQGAPCAGDRATAALVARMDPTVVLVLGDNQYTRGTLTEFRSSYDRTWGRFKKITWPTPGNHEYRTEGARGYFDYFGRQAEPPAGYYSFELGTWHLVAINSGNGDIGQEQHSWIRMDLASDDHRCQLAYWHHPLWTSGTVEGADPQPQDLDALWSTLFDAGVDVVLNGHAHQYERFSQLNPSGQIDPVHGIREFVVGTGGGKFHEFGDVVYGSEVRDADNYGVLELTLRDDAYGWRFVSVDGRVLDEGEGACHL